MNRLPPTVAAAIALALSAAPAAEQRAAAADVDEIVKRAFLREKANEAEARRYAFRFREERRSLDRGGKVAGAEAKTYEVTFLFGEEHERLIAVDDRPLDPRRDARERRKLEQRAAGIERRSAAQRRKRTEKIEREREEEYARIAEMRDLFAFSLTGEETLDGMETWVIRAEPRADYQPRSQRARFLQKVRGAFWIAKEDYGWVRLEAETLDAAPFRMFLLRLAKGSTFSLRRKKLEEGVWALDRFRMRADVRVGPLLTLRREILGSYGNYRKLPAEAPVEGALQRAPKPE